MLYLAPIDNMYLASFSLLSKPIYYCFSRNNNDLKIVELLFYLPLYSALWYLAICFVWSSKLFILQIAGIVLKYGNWEIAKIFLKRIIALGSCNTCEDFFLMTARLISCWTDTDQVWVGRIQSLFKNEIIRSRINDLDGSPKECWQKCLPSNISAEAVGCKFNKKGYFKESRLVRF
jgi:hypothetical protein